VSAGAGAGLLAWSVFGRDAAAARAQVPGQLRARLTAAPLEAHAAILLAVFLAIDVVAASYFREKIGAADNQFIGVAWACALLAALGWRFARSARTPIALAAAALVLPLALLGHGATPGQTARVTVPPLSQKLTFGGKDTTLLAYARDHSIYTPQYGDLNARSRHEVFPPWVNLVGLLSGGEAPGYLVHALLDRHFDAVAAFPQDQVADPLSSGQGRYEENYLWKLNKVIDARYAPTQDSALTGRGILERRPGAERAPWMRTCFGPFRFAGMHFEIRHGGGFWCRDGTRIALRGTPAATSEITTNDAVRQVAGDLPLRLAVGGHVEIGVAGSWALAVDRGPDTISVTMTGRGVPNDPPVTLTSSSGSALLRFTPSENGRLAATRGRDTLAVAVPASAGSSPLRVLATAASRVVADFGALRLTP
jgi:hypothetical protein